MSDALQDRFDRDGELWRDPLDVVAQWQGSHDPQLLEFEVRGAWWETLQRAGKALLVSREYEHLVLHLQPEPMPKVTYLRIPHPSGIAVSADSRRVYLASTRNPNQIYQLEPAHGEFRSDAGIPPSPDAVLVPTRTWYLPGSTYIHDLALVGGVLHANAVGSNCVVRIDDGAATRVWWPRSAERDGALIADQNVLQLNSIAAGASIEESYFTASGEEPGAFRPGHAEYPVDRRGVIFSGATREPFARGLTRPHSARLWNGSVLVANSGYGELIASRGGGYDVVARLPGWTRGLAVVGDTAFVGTSRVIPRFRQYAPGLDVDNAFCGVYAIDLLTGRVHGCIIFAAGNQVFAVEPISHSAATGFPFESNMRKIEQERATFYSYTTAASLPG